MNLIKTSILTLLISHFSVLSTEFTLDDSCPPSFELLEGGSCRLVSLYQFYTSADDHGGVRVPLPTMMKTYTANQISLGKFLFFDSILSVNKDMSCASCHQPNQGFSDGKKRSLGHKKGAARIELNRSAPSLWNVGFLDKLMWDGKDKNLEKQALSPLLNRHEMAMVEEVLVERLVNSKAYSTLFQQVYGQSPSIDNLATSLAAFQSSLISLNSRYDRYAHGDELALNDQEIKGLNAFRGFVGRCSQCHMPPLFTDMQMAVVGAPKNDLGFADPGMGGLIKDASLVGAFKVPTLRNITKSAPYFHSGQFDTLKEVVSFYNDNRGHEAPSEQKLNIHWHIHMTKGPALSKQDVKNIVAFLHTLEDETNLPRIPEKVPSGLPVMLSLN